MPADRAALVARQIAWLGANCECEELDGAGLCPACGIAVEIQRRADDARLMQTLTGEWVWAVETTAPERKRTMGGEHPLVAIKRLAHWEVEDEIGMLRTRLACISAQVDKLSHAPPEAATPRPECADDVCQAARRDGVVCADGECDYHSGARSVPEAAPAMAIGLCPLTLAESLAAIREDDCRAAVRAALREVREAIMCDDGCLTVAGAVAILDAKLAALEDAP